MNNIYGGFFYPGTPFIFDKIYQNYDNMINNAAKDEILVGRYVLIKYCEQSFSSEQKKKIEALADINATTTEDERQYFDNFYKDGGQRSYDRLVYRKAFNSLTEEFYYEEIVSLENASVALSEDIQNQIQNTVKTVWEDNLTSIINSATPKWKNVNNIS